VLWSPSMEQAKQVRAATIQGRIRAEIRRVSQGYPRAVIHAKRATIGHAMPRLITAFDHRSFARSLAIASVIALLTAAVMISTDGEPAGSGRRLARLGAMAPVFGAIGSAIAIAQARARGEMIALESLGVRPMRAQAGALSAGFVLGLLGAVAAVCRGADLEALFPRVAQSDWIRLADGAWRSDSGGVRIGPMQTDLVTFIAAGMSPAAWSPPRLPVMVAIALSGVVLPIWLQSRTRVWERIASGSSLAVVQVTLFHFVGAARVSAWALLIGPALMLAHGLSRR
jgi:hypothetical protein